MQKSGSLEAQVLLVTAINIINNSKSILTSHGVNILLYTTMCIILTAALKEKKSQIWKIYTVIIHLYKV